MTNESGGTNQHSTSNVLVRGLALLTVLLAATVVVLWIELQRARAPAPEPAPSPEPARLVLEEASWGDLAGWSDDSLDGVAAALGRSCSVWRAKDDAETRKAAQAAAPGLAAVPAVTSATPAASTALPAAARGIAGAPADWRRVCELAASASDAAALRKVIEDGMRPWSLRDGDGLDQALLTGYYEPTLRGSLRRSERFDVPLYLRPPELVDVDLGAFREALRGQRLAGVLRGNRLVPFADRTALEEGALQGRGLELVWVDDAIDAFFLHIQGSGRVVLESGDELRVGYAAQNGHPYVAIGRELVARGALALPDVTMQSIRAWLASHPDEAVEVMRRNPSFVFFDRLDDEGPVGSQGVALTPYRSIAVDPSFLPLGLPVWLAATVPSATTGEPDRAFRRLVVTQDTGGAIRGPLRADLFCGPGEEAAEVAGRLKHPARLWVFLPRHLIAPPQPSRPTP